ncbi:MAG: AsmA family protein [Flavobacteriales bacterium]|nr:MAG: AsmA family protein [Flavobacteriales bacterium]
MKKFIKILGIVLLVLILVIILFPLIFEGKIIEKVKQTANNNLNATVDFTDADLRIWSSFPNAEVALNKTSVVNKEPFEGDTLFNADKIFLKLPIMQLFKGGADMQITDFSIDGAKLNILVDSLGNANYDIALKGDDDTTTQDNTDPLKFNLDSYKITNSAILYKDVGSNMAFELTDFNHSGSGDLSAEKSQLQTKTSGLISFEMDSVAYLDKNQLSLDALLGIDLAENKYSFLENEAKINELPLVFDGFIKINEDNQEIDLSFKTPSSDFTNFLALIPKMYSKNIEGVKTTGNFDVNGKINGVIDEAHIPKFTVFINSDKASFKYPDLPKSLQNINIHTEITNKTGLAKDTYVLIDTLSFAIDNEKFSAQAKITELTENTKVNAKVNGDLNLANLEKVYPADAFKDLKGRLAVNVQAGFDMASIENKKYENTRINGLFNLRNFEFVSNELSDKLFIDKANISLNPKDVKLNAFDAKLGKTDLQATGKIHNLLGFMFNKEDMEGNFNLSSNTFSVNDFMIDSNPENTEQTNKKELQEETAGVKIPSFLNATINANANTVLYDNITLKNVKGTLVVKDQTATLSNMRSDLFGGNLGFSGKVSTKTETPTFNMELDMNSFNIDQSFTQLNLLKALAPIAKAIQGKLNSKINLSGNLNSDFTPSLNTISGKAAASLNSSKINKENASVLNALAGQLNFIEVDKINLNNLKTALSFKDGKVQVNPFTIKYKDIKIDVAGGHGFDNTLAYDAVIHVPAKYLGKEVNNLLAKFTDIEKEEIEIPVNADIVGTFSKPTVKTDFKSSVEKLTKTLVERQKQNLINKGKGKVEETLMGILSGEKEEKQDTTNTKTTKPKKTEDAAKDLIKGIFGSKKKKKDTVGNG